MKYFVATSVKHLDIRHAADDLTTQVNELLATGWSLQGGVSFSLLDSGGSRWCIATQALVLNAGSTVDV